MARSVSIPVDMKVKVHVQRNQDMVTEFHEAFDPESVARYPGWPEPAVVEMRLRLIQEEFEEVMAEMEHYYSGRKNASDTLLNVAQELADLLYVVYGTGVVLGLDLDPVLELVHEANMTKLWSDEDIATLPAAGDGSEDLGLSAVVTGHGTAVFRADGKVMKPPSFSPVSKEAIRWELTARQRLEQEMA